MPDFWEGTNVQIRVKCALLDGRKISSVGRAAPLHGDGQEFESLIFHHKMLARAVLCSSGFLLHQRSDSFGRSKERPEEPRNPAIWLRSATGRELVRIVLDGACAPAATFQTQEEEGGA